MNIIISYLLPLFYFVLLAFLLQRNKYLRSNGMSALAIILFFTGKCIAGVLSDFISIHYFENAGDAWLYFYDGLILYRALLHDPPAFVLMIKEMFTISDFSLLNPDSDFIRTVFEGIKFIHFLCNLFSFGNIYTNTILFNGVATLAFLRCWVFFRKYTSGWIAGAWIFLLPSAFFYTANILKEGLSYVLIALLLPMVIKVCQRPSVPGWFSFLMLFGLLFFFKFLIALSFAAALILWYFIRKFKRYRVMVFGLAIAVISGFVFLSAYINAIPNLLQYIINRQQEFLALPANTVMEMPVLQPNFSSFFKALPKTLGHVLFRPLPGEGGSMLYFIQALEIFFLWAFILFVGVKNRLLAQPSLVKPVFWAMLFFAIINLLVIGYIVPGVGAIVRYRSIFLPWVGVFFWYLYNGNHLLPKYHLILRSIKGK